MADGADTRRILEAWLKERLSLSGDVSLSPFSYPQGGTGNSADTSFADLRYQIDGRPALKSLVFRCQPHGEELFYKSEIDLPFKVMTALSSRSSVPAPNVLAVEARGDVIGEPFLVMGKVEGRVVNQIPNPSQGGWIVDLSIEQRNLVWRNAIGTLVQLRDLDWRDGFTFLDKRAYGKPGGRRGLARAIVN